MIERIFGVLKRCFKVLTLPQEYDLDTQAQIVSMLAVVHNFIKIHNPNDPLFKDKTLGLDSDTDESDMNQYGRMQQDRFSARREKITLDMWKAYWPKKKCT